jgi:hypothetical protein
MVCAGLGAESDIQGVERRIERRLQSRHCRFGLIHEALGLSQLKFCG